MFYSDNLKNVTPAADDPLATLISYFQETARNDSARKALGMVGASACLYRTGNPVLSLTLGKHIYLFCLAATVKQEAPLSTDPGVNKLKTLFNSEQNDTAT